MNKTRIAMAIDDDDDDDDADDAEDDDDDEDIETCSRVGWGPDHILWKSALCPLCSSHT